MENIFSRAFTSLSSLVTLRDRAFEKQAYMTVSGLLSSGKALFLYAIGKDIEKKLVVLSDEQTARELCEEYRFFEPNALYYPAKDILFFESDLRSNELTKERMHATQGVLGSDGQTVFTTAEALMNKLVSLQIMQESKKTYAVGDTLDLDQLRKTLVSYGYETVANVTYPGEFAVRGGIIDIFSMTEELPYRVELWGDEIDSIRRFDPVSQKSIEPISHLRIFSACEPELTETDADSFIDYFSKEAAIFLDEPDQLYKYAQACEEEFTVGMERRFAAGMSDIKSTSLIFSAKEVFAKLQKHRGVLFTSQAIRPKSITAAYDATIDTRPVVSFQHSISLLKREISNYKKKKNRVIITGMSRTRQKRLCESLMEEGLNCFYSENYEQPLLPGQILFTYGNISHGIECADTGYVFLTESDIFGQERKRKRTKKYRNKDAIQSFEELHIGDYVVHENYGLGIYQGLEQIEQEHVMKDFIKITYAKGSNLYVQTTQLDLISKYTNVGDRKPKLNSIGALEWGKTKARVKRAVDLVAKELVDLYALRSQTQGFMYGPDTVWQQEFEETFPYEETAGQEEAIKDVKSDLMSHKIMDRLICGDVGFGKTEIALRAAFKVVQENKQVVYLCPTTILAQQHYHTFVNRMQGYPIEVGLLSRFRSAAENKKTVEDLKAGKLDIVIGTHRALSKDVEFHDLGLLVIDEEQRFGVTHKEKIKQMKKSVDVLSLTATPIPRTLHMSLIGIRDMSLLEEAPLERLPVQTFVFEYNEEMVREALQRELSRGGQVYYVVNRVRQIADIAAKVQSLVPDVSVVYAHGKMPERKLEEIMTDFTEGNIRVLVATTIIEIGLDISNVNTIIIHDADQLGLSQLYQLRGRVGRSSRRAYAFLMYRKDKVLKEIAMKRLTAIHEFTELGSGFKIAMRDLEIRGAGNLLGEAQHGHMEAVGYDLYCKLLAEAVRVQRGETEQKDDFETTIEIDIDAFLPTSYIANEEQKLDIYKRISKISDEEEQQELVDELIDRFGDPGEPVMNLFFTVRLRHMAHEVYLTKIRQMGNQLFFHILPSAGLNPAAIPEFIALYRGKLCFEADKDAPLFVYQTKERITKKELKEFLPDVLDKMRVLLIE